MKALFWNIGADLSKRKIQLISEAIKDQQPDIFCLAEGSSSREKCRQIIDVFTANKFACYYSPLFVEKEELKLDYGYNGYGLKVFIRSEAVLEAPFSFSDQRESGRIIVLKVYQDFKLITFIFLHNRSQVGDPTLDPLPFIFRIKDMIEVGKITEGPAKVEGLGDSNRVIIIGDFNLEPWDGPLRHKNFLSTSFFPNQYAMNKRHKNGSKHYFNPIVEKIFSSKVPNLGGTFYSESNGWALFDFILYDTEGESIFYDIITKFDGGSQLLNEDMNIKKAFLNDGLDHLPIVVDIAI